MVICDYIRDNAIEPEKTLLNWHVHDNRISNTHAAFSIHDLHGGCLYIYGNRLWFDERGGADYQDNRGGKIYKLRRKGPLPDHPIHVFHNSLYTRTFLIKRARARHFVHRNNAVQFCNLSDHLDCLCREDREFFRQFPIDADERPIRWDETVVFDGDASNRLFDRVLREAEQETHGVVADTLGFSDPMRGNFAPSASSVLRNAGIVFTFEPDEDLPPGQLQWSNRSGAGKPHIGAEQDDWPISLPFVRMPFREPRSYSE